MCIVILILGFALLYRVSCRYKLFIASQFIARIVRMQGAMLISLISLRIEVLFKIFN